MNNEYYGAPSTPTSDFLAHYGVLGMKWGIHRAAKKGTNYKYRSHATKKYEKLAEKLLKKGKTEKAAIMRNRAKRSAEIDRGEEEYARGISTKKAIGLAVLGGTDRLKGYAQQRAMYKQKGKEATGHKVAAAATAIDFGSTGSRLRKAQYIRQGEKKNGIGRKLYNLDSKIHNYVATGTDSIARSYNQNKKKKRRT